MIAPLGVAEHLMVDESMDKKFAASENVIARQIGEETVILNIDTEAYFGLNEVGTFVWNRLSEAPSAVAELAKSVSETFDVSAEQASNDIAALFEDLQKQGLVEARDA
jgi:hypothetical protein